MAEEFVITGIGVISAAGIGKEVFEDALINNKSGLREITSFDTIGKKNHIGGEVRDFNLDAIFPDRRFRRAATVSKYCLAASKIAIDDAGLDPCKWDGTKVGLIVGVTHGAINYTREFHSALMREGPTGVSPMLFPDSVLNAAAGNVSIAFNIKGMAHTIIGGVPVGLAAIDYAIKIMRNSGLDLCLVGGTEEIDRVVFDGYTRFGLLSPNDGKTEGIKPFGITRNGFIIGEGACVLVIERKKLATIRGARIYANIHAAHTVVYVIPARGCSIFKSIPDNGNIYISTGANGTAKDSIEAKMFQTVFCSAGQAGIYFPKKPFIGNIKPIIGECFAASSMMQVASAAMVLYNGVIPPALIDYDLIPEINWGKFNPSAEEVEVKTAIVSSIGLEREGSFLVLKR